ncbi:MAG: HAD-IA family hydrolase [Vicinamibacterales bacterium]
MRSVLLLDLGNVVAFFDHGRACEALARLSRPAVTADVIHAGIFATGLEADFDRGLVTPAAFLAALRTWCPDATDAELAHAWSDIFRPNPAVVDQLPDLRRRSSRLVLASNTNALHVAELRRTLGAVLGLFDAHVLSFEVGEAKPSPRFFDACLAAAGARASDCVFVDDTPAYVAAAGARGIAGVVYAPGVVLPEALGEAGWGGATTRA